MEEYTLNNNGIDNLVDWKNPPSLKDLKNDLSEAIPSHTQHVDKVNSWIASLRGEIKIKVQEGRSKVQPKLVRKQSEWRYSALEEPFLSTNDMFVVSPVTHLDIDAARQNMLILNKQFRVDIPKVKFINKYIRTAVNTGTVIVKLSWESERGTVLEEVPVYTQTPEELYSYLQQLVMSGQMTEEEAVQYMQTGQPIQIGVESVPVEKEIINRPVLQVRDSRNVIIDPSCEGEISNAKFIVDRFLTDLSSLKKDSRYSNLDAIAEKEYSGVSDTAYYNYEYNNDPNFRFSDRPRQKLVAYEYWGFWDIDGNGIVKPIVATWIGDTVIRLEENPYPDKELPFVVVQYLPPDNDTVYGDADASLLKDNQDIIGAVSRAMIDLIGRSANAQQGIRKDLLDPINSIRFKQGLDFEYNPVPNLGDALFTTKLPEIPRSALEMIQLQNNEAEALTGVKAFTGGISGDALGNMLDLNTVVPLFDGTFKTVKELKLGDTLIGKNGKGTKITQLFAIAYPEKAYNITFSNGTTIKAGIEHKWEIKITGTTRKECEWHVATTGEIVEWFEKSKEYKKINIYIPRISPVDMEGSYPDVDPYCIGYWLGNDNSHCSIITTADEEVIARFSQLEANSNSFEYWLHTLGLMKVYGGEKHIPEVYFSAPYHIKLELLRGLMDANGYAHSGSFNVFYQTEGRLLRDVIRLLKSMGIVVRYNKTSTIEFSCLDNPFYTTRKAKKYKKPKQCLTHKIVNIEETDKVLMRCLQVDSPDHLFAITENMILTHNSVGGIRSALDATSKRELGILRRLSDGLKEIGKKIIAMNSVWLSDEEVIRITDEEFVAIKRSDLAGNFDLELTISTAETDNQKASELAFMLQTTSSVLPIDITKILLSNIARLRKMPDLAKQIEDYQPQPDPIAQEKAQLEIELLKAQITNEYSKARENEEDINLKAARAENERAKAGKTASERDKLDLDYVEQASGLQQERELEKQLMGQRAMQLNKEQQKPVENSVETNENPLGIDSLL